MEGSSCDPRGPRGQSQVLFPKNGITPDYWIPPHVRMCVTLTGTIILDLQRSRYLGIGVEETRALLALDAFNGRANAFISAPPAPMTRESAECMAELLIGEGLLSTTPEVDLLPAPSAQVLGALEGGVHHARAIGSVGGEDVMRFLRACWWARSAIRSRTLYSIACEIAGLKPRSSQPSGAVEADPLTKFQRLRPFAFASRNHCLFHALTLMRYLADYQCFPTWVIGVRARPWGAHSWVQMGNVPLDTSPERVGEYTPILAV
jgi:hypothetical protein